MGFSFSLIRYQLCIFTLHSLLSGSFSCPVRVGVSTASLSERTVKGQKLQDILCVGHQAERFIKKGGHTEEKDWIGRKANEKDRMQMETRVIGGSDVDK
jgi:hypothetical protein